MAFFRQEMAIDLGTANTVIFNDDQVVLDEPSIIALESKTDALYAIGKEAQQIEENTPPGLYTIRPLMNGVIADYDAAEKMLTAFIKKQPELKEASTIFLKKAKSRNRDSWIQHAYRNENHQGFSCPRRSK